MALRTSQTFLSRAAAKARYEQYNFDKMIYVVAAQQDLHFKQLFKVLQKMGYEWAEYVLVVVSNRGLIGCD